MKMAKIAASMVLASLSGISAFGDVVQNFDSELTGTLTASGWTVTGASAVVAAGTTPNGTQYLQVNDSLSTSAVFATYALPSLIDATSTVHISFLLRREISTPANANNADFVIFAKNTTTTVVQAGIKSNGAFYYVTGGSTTNNIPSLTSVDGTWYQFDIDYVVNSSNMTSSYSLAITDTSSNSQIFSQSGLAGRNLADSSYFNISAVQLKTTNSGIGTVDVDGINVSAVPEPSSIGIAGLSIAGAMLIRRTNGRKAGR